MKSLEQIIIEEAQSFFDEGNEAAAFGLLDLLIDPHPLKPL